MRWSLIELTLITVFIIDQCGNLVHQISRSSKKKNSRVRDICLLLSDQQSKTQSLHRRQPANQMWHFTHTFITHKRLVVWFVAYQTLTGVWSSAVGILAQDLSISLILVTALLGSCQAGTSCILGNVASSFLVCSQRSFCVLRDFLSLNQVFILLMRQKSCLLMIQLIDWLIGPNSPHSSCVCVCVYILVLLFLGEI